MSYRIETYAQLTDQLFSDWQRLWDASPCAHFFNHPSWFYACRKAFPSGIYRIFALYGEDNKLAAVLPLRKERRFGIKTFVCPGGRHLSKSAFLSENDDPSALLTLVESVLRNDNLYLAEIDERSAQSIGRNVDRKVLRESSVNPYFHLKDNPFGHQPHKRYKKACRSIKSLHGHLSYRCSLGSKKAMQTAFAIDLNSSKRKQGKATFVGEGDHRFFLQLVSAYKDKVAVCILTYDRMPIVFEIGFLYKNIYHVCNTAYDSAYARLSPRRMLLYHTLHRLQRERYEIFDFSRGRNPLKDDFTSLTYKQYDAYFPRYALVSWWWQAAGDIYYRLLNNKIFYKGYLFLKSKYIAIKDSLN